MSASFKSRLGSALMNSGSGASRVQANQTYQSDLSGINSATKRNDHSATNQTVNGTGILSERVSRISEKIQEIHTNIEKGKVGKLDEYNRKVS